MTRRAHLGATRESGFTLIEMLAAMIFIGILFAGFSLVLTSTLHHNDEVQEESTLQTQVRATIDRLAQDLRQAYTGDDAVYPLESISPTQLSFYSPDRQTPFHLRHVSYRLNAGTLERAEATSTDTDGAPWSMPALGVWMPQVASVASSAVFTYLDESGATATTPETVHTVNVTISVETTTSGGRQFTYATSVTLRTPA